MQVEIENVAAISGRIIDEFMLDTKAAKIDADDTCAIVTIKLNKYLTTEQVSEYRVTIKEYLINYIKRFEAYTVPEFIVDIDVIIFLVRFNKKEAVN